MNTRQQKTERLGQVKEKDERDRIHVWLMNGLDGVVTVKKKYYS